MNFLVTAGNTREMIDQVRCWTNIFTGGTGLSIAQMLSDLGPVDLITSNSAHVARLGNEQGTSHPIRATLANSHAEMKGAMAALLGRTRYDAVVMTAAVSDYSPAGAWAVAYREPMDPPAGQTDAPRRERWVVQDVSAGKVKSDFEQVAILGQRTEKLVDLVREPWGHTGLLVKFKLEVAISDEDLVQVGQASRRRSKADYLVANTLAMTSGPKAGAYWLSEGGHVWVSRDQIPLRIMQAVLAGC